MLAIEMILGALTGYFTNDIAIRQLFAKNGVVVRERAQFTEMIVQVLQEQIIDEKTVQSLEENPEVAMLVERALRTFFTEELPFALSDCTLADVDTDGALRCVFQAQMKMLDFSQVKLDEQVIKAQLQALSEDVAFRTSVATGLANLSALSPATLGFSAWVEKKIAHFQTMDADAFGAWLSRLETYVADRISALWLEASTNSPLCLRDILGMDGTHLLGLCEDLILSGYQAQHTRWLDVLKDTSLQSQLYTFSERFLKDMAVRYLPTLIEVFIPLLIKDRAQIEQMLLECVEESGEGSIFCEAITGILQKKFKEYDDEKLLTMAKAFTQGEQRAALCEKVAQFLQSWVVRAIDEWRQLAVDDAERVAMLHKQLDTWRPFAVSALDRLLALPLRRLFTAKSAQELRRLVFEALAKLLRPEMVQALYAKHVMPALARPFADTLLTQTRRDQLAGALFQRMKTGDLTFLAQLAPQKATLQEALYALFDDWYTSPLARFFCETGSSIPYGALAETFRKIIFSNMRPFLGQITEEHLNALSHAEIRALILGMIGHEMRPLAYLGGGIGAAAGVATGVAMEMSGVAPDPDQVAAFMAARTGMYGVVGYGTNVAAVNGLFRPYRKTLGFQGLMSKKQGRFAEKMKDLAAEYIINDSIWNEQIQRLSVKLNDDFIQILQQGRRALYKANQARIMIFFEKTIKAQAGRWLYNGLDQRHLIDLIKSTITFRSLTAAVIELAGRQHIYKKSAGRLSMLEANTERVSAFLLGKMQGITATQWEKTVNYALSLITMPTSSSLYDRVWQYFASLYDKLPTLLLTQQDVLATGCDAVLRKQLSFTSMLGYRMAGGKHFVEAVVHTFLTQKLPGYLVSRQALFSEGATYWLKGEFAGKSILDCGLTLSASDGEWLHALCQSLQQASVSQVLFKGLRHIEALPEDIELRVIQAALDATGVFLKKQNFEGVWQSVDWRQILSRLGAPVVLFGEGMMKDVSLNTLLSLPEGRLQTIITEFLTLDEYAATQCTMLAERLWQMLSPVCMAALSREGRALVILIDVPGLVEDRINSLSPQLLEELIRGIAQPYFTRVERMGWLGAVVAVPATVISRLLGGF